MPPRGPSDPRYRTSDTSDFGSCSSELSSSSYLDTAMHVSLKQDTSDLFRKYVIKFDIFCQGKYGIVGAGIPPKFLNLGFLPETLVIFGFILLVNRYISIKRICPDCGYALRKLEPSCPSCGRVFSDR